MPLNKETKESLWKEYCTEGIIIDPSGESADRMYYERFMDAVDQLLKDKIERIEKTPLPKYGEGFVTQYKDEVIRILKE